MDYYIELLLNLYRSHGELLFENPSIIKEEMAGFANVEKSRVYALASAIEEKVPVTLRDMGNLSEEDLELVGKGFAEGTGIKEELATWAVRVIYSAIQSIENEPSLRRHKRKIRVQEGSHVEVKEGLVKIIIIKDGESQTHSYDGTLPLVDFLEPYIEDNKELEIEISGDIVIERPLTVQDRKLSIKGVGNVTVFSEISPAFEIIRSDVIFENLQLKHTKEPERTMGLIFAVESKVDLKKVELQGSGIKVQNSRVDISKSKVHGSKFFGFLSESSEVIINGVEFIENGIDVFSPQVRIRNCKTVIKNTKITNGNGLGIWAESSELNLEKVNVTGNYYYGIFIDTGTVMSMTNCRLAENGNSEDDYPQLKITSSKAYLRSSRILNGVNNTGVLVEDSSYFECEDLKITGHYFHGIQVREDSEILVKSIELARNGNEDEDKAQVLFESSKGYIKNAKIHGGVNNSGIVLSENSSLEMVNSHVYRHFFNAILVHDNSELLLSDCEIYENGNDQLHAPQIWISSGAVKIENSNIFSGFHNDGIYVRNSSVSIANSSIFDHWRRGIFAEGNAFISVNGSKFYSNNRGQDGEAQIECRSCTLKIADSDVDGSVNGTGIYATDISNVDLSNVKIINNYGQGLWFSSNTTFIVKECLISGNLGKDGMLPQILVTSSRGRFEKTKVSKGQRTAGIVAERSFVQMVESVICDNENYGVYILSNSALEMSASEVYGNGQEAKDFPQIRVENSKLVLKASKVYSGVGNCGVSVVDSSYAEIENTIIHDCVKHGVEVYYNSELRFLDSEVYNNGSDSDNFSQIWLGSSYAVVKNSLIHDGKKNTGLGVLKSYLELENCKIYGHEEEGINAAWYSGIKLKECKIYSNASKRNLSQVSISSSNCLIRGSEITGSLQGVGVKIEDGSSVEIDNTKISENKTIGIRASNSEVKLSGCELLKNNELVKNGSQIEIENTRFSMKNCKVCNGVNGSGLRISNSLLVELYHSTICDHKGSGIDITDSISRVKIVGVNTSRNEKGGLIYKNPYKVSFIDSVFEDGAFRRS